MWLQLAWYLALVFVCASHATSSQETPPKPPDSKSEPQYDDTFSGPIVDLTAEKITVSRSILGKPEKKTFLIKADTKIEGKLKVKVKVTVGFVSLDEGDVARLIVVRPQRGNR